MKVMKQPLSDVWIHVTFYSPNLYSSDWLKRSFAELVTRAWNDLGHSVKKKREFLDNRVFEDFMCVETFWNYIKMILLISEMRFKKISSKNIFSSRRKIILKKSSRFFFRTFSIFEKKNVFEIFLLEKIRLFQVKKSRKNVFFFKNQKCPKKNRELFFKIIFLHDEKIFFDEIFFKPHLQYQENHFDTVSESFYAHKVFKNPII